MTLREFFKKYRAIVTLLVVLVLLTPFVYLIAEHFNFGEAWGEWDSEVVKELTGIAPEGMKQLEGVYKNAPLSDYSFFQSSNAISYFLSGLTGIVVILLIFFFLRRVVSGKASR